MKKIITISILILASMLCLTACIKCECNCNCGGGQHTHAFGEWKTTKVPSCLGDGEKVRFCSCGEKQVEIIYSDGKHTEVIDEAVEATCINTGLTEGKHCSVCEKVLVEQQELPMTGHRINEDTWYERDKVYSLYTPGVNLFADAALDCEDFCDGYYICLDCGSICMIDIVKPHTKPDDYLSDPSCPDCHEDISVDTNDGVFLLISTNLSLCVLVEANCFDSQFVIPQLVNGCYVTGIDSSAFISCENITSIVIPASVTEIEAGAFRYCENLTNVYYLGSEEQWNKISIGENNQNLLNANVAYNYVL